MSKPILSIAVIAKNEASNLPDLFASLVPLKKQLCAKSTEAVEVIVVDTGSTDDTTHIAQEHGALVYKHPWEGHFAKAKNKALEHCQGNWILWLDADDRIQHDEEELNCLTTIITKNNELPCAYRFHIQSPDGKNAHNTFLQTRLFPNQLGVVFSYPIHESLTPSLQSLNILCKDVFITILHTGYQDTKIVAQKQQRNKTMLETWLQKSDDESSVTEPIPLSSLFSLARIYHVEENWSQAEKLYLKILSHEELWNKYPDLYVATSLYYGQCLGFQNRLQEALSVFEKQHKQSPKHTQNNPQFLFEWGKLYFALDNKPIAQEKFTQAQKAFPFAWSIPTDWESIREGIQWFIEQGTLSPFVSASKSAPSLPISVCVILKNERHRLDTFFASLQSILHRVEWIIADTGSTDGTQEYLSQKGIPFFHFEWCDDFSKARNSTLEKATKPWILWLDADDIVPENFWSAVPFLKASIQSNTPENSTTPTTPTAYRCFIHSPRDNNQGDTFKQVRIFPNHPNIRFRGCVHEELSTSLTQENIPIEDLNTTIEHMGYWHGKERLQKSKRNLTLLEKERKGNPEETAVVMEYGNCLYQLQDYEKALTTYTEHFEKHHPINHSGNNQTTKHSPLLKTFPTLIANTYVQLDQKEKAHTWYQLATKLDPDDFFPFFWLGKRALLRNNRAVAEEHFVAIAGLSIENTIDIVARDNFSAQVNAQGYLLLLELDKRYHANETPNTERLTQLWHNIKALPPEKCPIPKEVLEECKEWIAMNNQDANRGNIPGQNGIPVNINECFGKISSPFNTPYPANTLSIVMIVKNESENIEAAIRSFLPIADEIIVNDTGSTDGTQDILEKLEVTWFQSTWENNFSRARNQSIEKATSSWILWMDADDRLPADQVENFLKLKQAPLDRIFGFQVINTQAGKPYGTRFMQLRMFPNHPDIRFERNVHEQFVFSAAKLGVHCFYLDLTIHHTGYEDENKKREKALRNLQLCEQNKDLLEQDPTFSSSRGDALYILERWEEGIQSYMQTWNIPKLEKIHADLYHTIPLHIGIGHQHLQRHSEAIQWFDKALTLNPQKLEPYYHKAQCLEALNQKEEALSLYQTILEMPLNHSATANQYDTIRIYSFYYLGLLWMHYKKDFPKAIQCWLQMQAMYPDILESWEALGDCYLETQEWDKAKEAWKTCCKLNPDKSSSAKQKLQSLQQKNTPIPSLSKKGISLCMIVKNESSKIGNCLDSVRSLVQEIIVVDTGSTDNTVEIASSYGATIHHFHWTNDFSAARNFSLDKANCPWILWLDGDDVLLPEDQKMIQSWSHLFDDQSGDPKFHKAYGFQVKNTGMGGRLGSAFHQIRLFPNIPELRFCNPIHEQILPAIEKQSIPIEYTEVSICHTGYEDAAQAKEKQKRNRAILQTQIDNQKNVTAVTLYTYAHACYDLEDYTIALDYFLNATELAEKTKSSPHVIQVAPAKVASCLLKLERYGEALATLQMDLKKLSPFPETLFVQAQVCATLGRKEDAAAWFLKILSLTEETHFVPVDYGLLKLKALEFLGKHWFEKGREELGKELLRLGLSIQQGNSVYLQDVEELYAKA